MLFAHVIRVRALKRLHYDLMSVNPECVALNRNDEKKGKQPLPQPDRECVFEIQVDAEKCEGTDGGKSLGDMGRLIDEIQEPECRNYIHHCGYRYS